MVGIEATGSAIVEGLFILETAGFFMVDVAGFFMVDGRFITVGMLASLSYLGTKLYMNTARATTATTACRHICG